MPMRIFKHILPLQNTIGRKKSERSLKRSLGYNNSTKKSTIKLIRQFKEAQNFMHNYHQCTVTHYVTTGSK
jgi:hypothetical protein